LALTAIGFALTLLCGVPFILWCLAHWEQLYGQERDTVAALPDLWRLLRWPVLGIGIFLFTWLWALLTSLQIVQAAKAAEKASLPPRLS
jgi:hypothetical protein